MVCIEIQIKVCIEMKVFYIQYTCTLLKETSITCNGCLIQKFLTVHIKYIYYV